MKLDQLRNERTLQSHHWLAAKWFAEQVASGSPIIAEIEFNCRLHGYTSACFGMDSFVLLNRAVVARETLADNERVIGVLRETLNMVDRIMRRARKNSCD